MANFTTSLRQIDQQWDSLNLPTNLKDGQILSTWLKNVGSKMLIVAAHKAYEADDLKNLVPLVKLINELSRDTLNTSSGVQINFNMSKTMSASTQPTTSEDGRIILPHEQRVPFRHHEERMSAPSVEQIAALGDL